MRALAVTAFALALAVAAVGALACVAAPVAAQSVVRPTLTASVTDPGQDLVPDRPFALSVKVRYAYGAGAFTNEEISITLEIVEKPDWASAELVDSVIRFRFPPQTAALGGAVEGETFANVTAIAKAPARERANFTVKATAKSTGNIEGAETLSPQIGLRAAFVQNLNVTSLVEETRVRGGRDAFVTFVVANLGNGDTEVNLRVATKPENSLAEVPGEIFLKAGESAEVDVRVRTPWVATERGLLELEAIPARAGDDAEKFLGSVEVVGLAVVPDAGVLAALAAALGVALAGRRERRA